MKKQGKDRLLEVMSRLDSTFKPKLNENFNDSENEERLLNLRKMILLKQEELRAEINKLTTLNLPENIKWDLQKLQMELDTVSEKLHYSNSEMSIDEIYNWILDLERDISNYIAYVNDLGQEDDSEYMNLQRPKMNNVQEINNVSENTLNESSNKTSVNFLGMDLEVTYEYSPEEKEVRYYSDGSGYPGSPEEFYVYEVFWDDSDITEYFSSKGLDEISRITREKLQEEWDDKAIEYGERNI